MEFDRVKNRWRARRGVLVLDIETERRGGFSAKDKRDKTFLCGVIFDYETGRYHAYSTPQLLIKHMEEARAVVTFNGEGFDYFVLEKYGLKTKRTGNRLRPARVASYDIMHDLQARRPKAHRKMKYPKLSELMETNLRTTKSEYDHSDPGDLLRHCREDVRFTRRLYELKSWQVPVVQREGKKRWRTQYDNDLFDDGFVDDGETYTRMADFGVPLSGTTFNKSGTKCAKCGAELWIAQRTIMGTARVSALS